MTSKETADTIRGMARRATAKNVNDTGQMQTASFEVAPGVWRENIEIAQPYGFAGHVDEDGAEFLLIALGGDQGDLVALPLGNPSQRMGKLPAKQVGLYNSGGDRIMLRPDGTIEVAAGTALSVKVEGVTFNISAAGVDIQGGKVTHNGKNIGDDHEHKDVTPGSALTGPPA